MSSLLDEISACVDEVDGAPSRGLCVVPKGHYDTLMSLARLAERVGAWDPNVFHEAGQAIREIRAILHPPAGGKEVKGDEWHA